MSSCVKVGICQRARSRIRGGVMGGHSSQMPEDEQGPGPLTQTVFRDPPLAWLQHIRGSQGMRQEARLASALRVLVKRRSHPIENSGCRILYRI